MRPLESGDISHGLRIEDDEVAPFIPSRNTPRSVRPMHQTGNEVIFRMASSSDNTFSSRTYRPSTRREGAVTARVRVGAREQHHIAVRRNHREQGCLITR